MKIHHAAALLSITFTMIGCVAQSTDSESTTVNEDTGEAEQALLSGYWTATTSEEYPPLSCSNGYVIDAMYCSGSNCDNVALHCGSLSGRNIRNISWTSYFSEEGTNYRVCPSNQFMVGVACKGSKCDDMSIQCASFDNTTRSSNCYWAPFFSEEAAYSYLSSGYYAAGLKCTGGNCDNLSIYACQLY